MNDLQRQFQGYLSSSLLWKDKLLDLEQLNLRKATDQVLNTSIPDNLRLGHLVEHFILQEFKTDSTIELLAHNTQIIQEKETLGEFDYLLRKDDDYLHIEAAYKFYLLDPSISDKEINCWIGPNRKDTLLNKLTKIKEKQFPLLHHPTSVSSLDELGITTALTLQRTYVKGQLYLPYESKFETKILNQHAVTGFYVKSSQVINFNEAKFFFPSKHNWLIEPFNNVNWLSFDKASEFIQDQLDSKRSPMVWFKLPNGELRKAFVVWW
ncbi:MAG: DUF1853 family protein [Crocinitomicaceae bacterium]|nr:DUF1853 family protein [Crocinitomicaceae bacterium]